MVDSYMERHEVYPPFSEYQKFIQQEAEILCDPVTSSLYTRGGDKPQRRIDGRSQVAHTLHTQAKEKKAVVSICLKLSNPVKDLGSVIRSSHEKYLLYDSNMHPLDSCYKFNELPLDKLSL